MSGVGSVGIGIPSSGFKVVNFRVKDLEIEGYALGGPPTQ